MQMIMCEFGTWHFADNKAKPAGKKNMPCMHDRRSNATLSVGTGIMNCCIKKLKERSAETVGKPRSLSTTHNIFHIYGGETFPPWGRPFFSEKETKHKTCKSLKR